MSRFLESGEVKLPPSVRLAADSTLPRLDIAGRHATAQVYFHGAHLAAWQPSHAPAPVLWMSGHSVCQPDKPIRGGIPVCFPWFGAHPQDATVPAHGFARISPWTLCGADESADGTVTLAFQLETDNASPVWPHYCHADVRFTIGRTLTVAFEVHDVDEIPFSYEAALHTYLTVGSIDQVTVSGLERTAYLDKVAGGARQQQGDEPIRFTGETDRVYLDTSSACVVHDPILRRRITVAKQGSRSTVVWNPWIRKAAAMPDFGDDEWPRMVCVETANVGAAAVTIRPGDRHTMTAAISVEPE